MSNPHDPYCHLCNGKGYISDGRPEDGMMTGRQDCPGYGWRRVERPSDEERYHKHGPSSDPYDVEQRELRAR